jgi:integrase/recombinase XerC
MPFVRQRHRDARVIPPSQRATRESFARWRDSLEHSRKPVIARRDYVMGKLTYTSGVRAAELCEEPSCERTGDQLYGPAMIYFR